jgi:CHASE3 domain sensor protein
VSAFANLPISRKLMAAFAAVVAVIFVSSAIVYDRLRVIETATSWRVHTAQVLETLQMAMDAMLDQETGVRGYMVSGNEISLEPYQSGGNAFTAAMRTLKDLTADNPAQQSRLDELNELAMQWRSGVAEREIALMAKPETREDARDAGATGDPQIDPQRCRSDERQPRWKARVADQDQERWLGRRARRDPGFGPGARSDEHGPRLRAFLHDQARGHGHGPRHLPLNHRRSRGTAMGRRE